MTWWLITPRDPLIFRDGRPFTAAPGARATTLPFPFPSTLAGFVRTLAGTNAQTGEFDPSQIDALLQYEVRGPLLAKLDVHDDGLFVPAPADALMLRVGGEPAAALRLWLRPIVLPEGVQTDFNDLPYIVAPHRLAKEKVHRDNPAFWAWSKFEVWLSDPQDETRIEDIRSWGLSGLPQEYRVHVRIAPATQTAEAGGLFVTSGLEFTWLPDGKPDASLREAVELGLLIETSAKPTPDWGFLGGERRIACWHPVGKMNLSSCPENIRKQVIQDKACRIVLLTPAIFEHGYLPSWILQQAGAQAEVIAAAIPRYPTVSGWDYRVKRPKATRRLTAAGSVYYLKLHGDADAMHAFINTVWMQNISDDEQDRRDGFGLAVLGTWNGTIGKMEAPDA